MSAPNTARHTLVKVLVSLLSGASMSYIWRVVASIRKTRRAFKVIHYVGAEAPTAPRGWKLDARDGELLLLAWFTVAGSRFTASVHIGPSPDQMPGDITYQPLGDSPANWRDQAEADGASDQADFETDFATINAILADDYVGSEF